MSYLSGQVWRYSALFRRTPERALVLPCAQVSHQDFNNAQDEDCVLSDHLEDEVDAPKDVYRDCSGEFLPARNLSFSILIALLRQAQKISGRLYVGVLAAIGQSDSKHLLIPDSSPHSLMPTRMAPTLPESILLLPTIALLLSPPHRGVFTASELLTRQTTQVATGVVGTRFPTPFWSQARLF